MGYDASKGCFAGKRNITIMMIVSRDRLARANIPALGLVPLAHSRGMIPMYLSPTHLPSWILMHKYYASSTLKSKGSRVVLTARRVPSESMSILR